MTGPTEPARTDDEVEALLEKVVGWVGRDRFDAAVEWAWRTAEGTGRAESAEDAVPTWPDDVREVPHDVADVLYPDPTDESDPLRGQDDVTRMRVLLAAYRRMPTYALVMTAPAVRTPAVLAVWDDALRELLDDPDPRLADPLSYHLWSGDFEEAGEVDRTWAAVTEGIEAAPLRLVRVLEVAGPVPWRLKRELYGRVGDDPRWRPFVRDSVATALEEAYGDVDEDEARRWLEEPPPAERDTPEHDTAEHDTAEHDTP